MTKLVEGSGRSGRVPAMSRARAVALAALAALAGTGAGAAASAGPLAAQEPQVSGTAFAEDGRTVPGVLVTLERADGGVLRRTLTDGAGQFRIPLPDPGAYRLQAARLGYRPTTSALFRVEPGQPVRMDLRLAAEPIALEGIEVAAGETRCVLSLEEGTVLADLWEQARQTFARVEAARAENVFRFDLRRYRRTTEILTASITGESWQWERGSPDPFRSLPADDLMAEGWVREAGQFDVEYHGPAPETLLSDAFRDGHCFRLRLDPERPAAVGVAFEPAEPPRAPGIRGTLWMDRGTAELRELTFIFTGHPHDPQIPEELLELFGGEMEFRALPDGSWVVDRWQLRMPSFRPDGQPPGQRPLRRDLELARRSGEFRERVEAVTSWWWRNQVEQGLLVFQQEGGELARIEWPDGTVVAEREREAGMEAPEAALAVPSAGILRSLRGARETDGEPGGDFTGLVRDGVTGEPVPHARVTLLSEAGEPRGTGLTDQQGRFELAPGADGTYVLEVDRLGYEPLRTEPFVVEAGAPLPGPAFPDEIELAPRAIELEEVVAEGYAARLLHEATLEGAYARRARSPGVGSNRVLVRGDPELEAAQRVGDLLPPAIRPSGPPYGEWCGVLFLDGWESAVMGPEAKAFLLNLPVSEVEAVEYYRDLAAVPMSLRPLDGAAMARWDFQVVRECGVLGVWRRAPHPSTSNLY